MSDFLARPLVLILFSSASYAAAAYAMKAAAISPRPQVLGLIAVFLVLAALFEITVLQHQSLGLTYIAIVATETLLILCLAWAIGEGLTGAQVLGGALVVGGAALVNG